MCDIEHMENQIGLYIRARLKVLKKTQTWLAEKCEVSNNAVAKWIRTGKVSRENAVLIAKNLDTTIDKLLGNDVLSVENELERQLLMFFRGMTTDHQDDALNFSNNLYSIDNPNDKRSNPLNRKQKAKI